MKLFQKCKDGGPESTVWAYVLIEIKKLFSVMVLKFEDGSRDVYHDHAFNCVSWVLSGKLEEDNLDGPRKWYRPSFWPVITRRSTYHKVTSHGVTWVITFRGPWRDRWNEYHPKTDRKVVLTHGRNVVASD